MAKSASTTPAAQSRITRALNKAADLIGATSVTSAIQEHSVSTARASFTALMRVWVEVCIAERQTPAQFLTMVKAGFKALKKRSGDKAKAEYLRIFKLHPEGMYAPRGTAEAARKNGSKGVRQRRRAVMSFVEMVEVDPQAALDSVKPDSLLSWSEKVALWSATKRARCEESGMLITVGTDSDDLVHPLGENYVDLYTPTTDEKTGVETCEITVGPKGRTENRTVTVSQRRSGEVYKELAAVILASRSQLANARAFCTATEDSETLEEHFIPPIAD
tara:strand:+ start:178 stop:1005 length:828 start_codon:yes stop_codon:yes gene_type:complete